MEFKSQICTTKEQSERLLALGLKNESADCFLEYIGLNNYANHVWYPTVIVNNFRMPDYSKDIPAWSLHRLIEIIPNEIPMEDYYLILGVSFDCVYYADNEYVEVFHGFDRNTYSCIIKCVEWLINEGYFNKEYLNEK